MSGEENRHVTSPVLIPSKGPEPHGRCRRALSCWPPLSGDAGRPPCRRIRTCRKIGANAAAPGWRDTCSFMSPCLPFQRDASGDPLRSCSVVAPKDMGGRCLCSETGSDIKSRIGKPQSRTLGKTEANGKGDGFNQYDPTFLGLSPKST